MNINVRSVIPTDFRSSARGWSDGVEEPAVWLARVICGFRKNLSRAIVPSILLLCNGIAAAGQSDAAAATDAQKQFSNITSALANNTVASIDILHMPDAVETRASVTPENLERWFDFRITINKAREWAGRDEFVKTLRS